jgi:hypothetical protein
MYFIVCFQIGFGTLPFKDAFGIGIIYIEFVWLCYMPWNAPGCHMFLFVFVCFCTFLHMIVFLVQICIYIYDLYIVIMFFFNTRYQTNTFCA